MASRSVAVNHVSPLSAFKVALAMALIGLVAWLIAVAVLYFGMDAVGIWDSVNTLIGDVGGSQAITFGMVMAIAALMGAILAIFIAIIAPLCAVIYNGIVALFGGLQVGLQEEN